MKKSIICLCVLVLCDKAEAAGDRSGIEPVGKSTASFLPPITPPLSGSSTPSAPVAGKMPVTVYIRSVGGALDGGFSLLVFCGA